MANKDTEYFQFKKDGDKYYVRDNRIPEIQEDITKLKSTDESLDDKITEETTARGNADKELNDKITQLNTDLGTVRTDLGTETSRAQDKEKSLADDIEKLKGNVTNITNTDNDQNTKIENQGSRIGTLETKVADLGAYELVGIDQQLQLPVDTSKWTSGTPYITVESGFRSNPIPQNDQVIAAYTSAGNAPGTSTDVFLTSINTISNPTNGTKYLVMAYYLRIEAQSNPGTTVMLPFDLHITVRRAKQ